MKSYRTLEESFLIEYSASPWYRRQEGTVKLDYCIHANNETNERKIGLVY